MVGVKPFTTESRSHRERIKSYLPLNTLNTQNNNTLPLNALNTLKTQNNTVTTNEHREKIKSYKPLRTLNNNIATENTEFTEKGFINLFNITSVPSVISVAKYIFQGLCFSLCLCVSVVCCIFAVSGFAQEDAKTVEDLEKEKAANPYANDFGPDSIDVSGYPDEQKENYALFRDRCAKCHTIARPINSQFALSDEWERYVKRMMRKPGCTITPNEGKQIWKFLVYDSEKRKLGESQPKWEEFLKKLLSDFKQKYPERYKELYETQQ